MYASDCLLHGDADRKLSCRRSPATLCVVEKKFATSLEVTQGQLEIVPFDKSRTSNFYGFPQ